MRFVNLTSHLYATLTVLTAPGATVVSSEDRPRLRQEMILLNKLLLL